MHIPYESQILLVPRGLTYCAPPFFNRFQYLHLHSRRSDRGPLREPPHELIKEFLGTDLKVKRVSAVLDANIEQVESQQGDVGVPMIDVIDDSYRCLPRRISFLRVD